MTPARRRCPPGPHLLPSQLHFARVSLNLWEVVPGVFLHSIWEGNRVQKNKHKMCWTSLATGIPGTLSILGTLQDNPGLSPLSCDLLSTVPVPHLVTSPGCSSSLAIFYLHTVSSPRALSLSIQCAETTTCLLLVSATSAPVKDSFLVASPV